MYYCKMLNYNMQTSLVGIESCSVQQNHMLHCVCPPGWSSTSFGWGKGGKVTSAGWQVTLCDLIWHVISRSGVVISITNCYIRFTLLYFTCSIFLVFYSPTGWCCLGELGQWNGWYIHDSLYCDAARPNWYSYLLVILETFFWSVYRECVGELFCQFLI